MVVPFRCESLLLPCETTTCRRADGLDPTDMGEGHGNPSPNPPVSITFSACEGIRDALDSTFSPALLIVDDKRADRNIPRYTAWVALSMKEKRNASVQLLFFPQGFKVGNQSELRSFRRSAARKGSSLLLIAPRDASMRFTA